MATIAEALAATGTPSRPARPRGTVARATARPAANSIQAALGRVRQGQSYTSSTADPRAAFNPRPAAPAKPKDDGGSFWGDVGGFFTNIGKEATAIVTGVPGFLSLAGRTVSTPFSGAYAGLAYATGLPGGSAALNYTKDVGHDLAQAGEAIKDDYVYRYGPLFRGDFGTFGERVYERPLSFGLDVATVATAGAGATVGAARAGSTAARAAGYRLKTARIPSRAASGLRAPRAPGAIRNVGHQLDSIAAALSRVGNASRAPARTRAPIRYVREQTEGARLVGATDELIPRKMYARNPVTRAVQKGIYRTGTAVFDRAGQHVRVLSREARDDRIAARYHKRSEQRADAEALHTLAQFTRDYRRAVKKFSPNEAAALALHLRGITENVSGRTARQRLETAIDTWATSLREMETELGPTAAAKIRTQLEMLRQLPDELVHLDPTNPKTAHVLEAAKKGRELVHRSQEYAIKKGYITRKDAEARRRATEETLLHGVRYDDDLGAHFNPAKRQALLERHGVDALHTGKVTKWVRAIDAARRVNREIPAKYRALPEYRFADALLATGRLPKRQDGKLDFAPLKAAVGRAVQRHEAGKIPVTRDADGAITGVNKGLLEERRAFDRADKELLDKVKKNPILYQELRKAARTGNLRHVDPKRRKDPVFKAVMARVRNDSGALDDFLKRGTSKGGQFLDDLIQRPSNRQAPFEGFSRQAVHMSDYPIGFMSARRGRKDAARGFGPGAGAQFSTRELLRSGDVSLSTSVPVYQAHTVIRSATAKRFASDVIDRWAMRRGGTKCLLTGTREDAMRGLDPEKWTPISKSGLDRVMRHLPIVAPGDSPPSVAEAIGSAIPKEAGDVYVVPKAIGDELQAAFKDPNSLIRAYDSGMQMWRAGILAFTPRWYLNNLFGVTFQYGLMTGYDVRAIGRARQERFKRLIPADVESTSFSQDARHSVRASLNLQPKGVRERVARMAQRGFEINQAMEGLWRRAAYLSAARSHFHADGSLPKRHGRTPAARRRQDEELVNALERAPEAVKNEILEKVEFYMGNFKRMSRFEKDALRRILPFYSWLRVINTLVFGLPFKSAARAQALNLASIVGAEFAGDRTGLPIWERGRIQFGGTTGLALRTSGLNPLQSVAEEVAAVGAPGGIRSSVTDLLRVAGGQASPPLQIAIGQISGRNPFGTRDYSTSPDFEGTRNQYGRGRTYRNPVTGNIETVESAPNIGNQILEAIPYVPTLRQILAGERRPYDTSGVSDQVMERLGLKDEADVYQPPEKYPRGRKPIPYASAVAQILGLPVYTYNRDQERARTVKDERNFMLAGRETRRQILKELNRRRKRND